jgi:hypothetical protein
MLTNIEVLELLKEKRSSRTNMLHIIDLQPREYIEAATVKFLQNSLHSADQGKGSNSVMTARFFAEMKRLSLLSPSKGGLSNVSLTESELLEMSNSVPRAEVELLLLITDCHIRCSEKQVAVILDTIAKSFDHLPK